MLVVAYKGRTERDIEVEFEVEVESVVGVKGCCYSVLSERVDGRC